MTSKPPYEMAASGHSDSADTELEDLSDQLTVDASQDVTVEAAEEATLEIGEEETLNTLTPPPISFATPPPSRRAPTLMGLPLPSLPLPGVTAAASHPLDSDDEVTVMARPSVTDDEEEATKVEPAETALHAAASKDDDELTTALSAQASVERERALRKSLPPSLDLPLPGYGGDTDSEFEDPEDEDGISLASDTPAISVDDDAIATSSYSADSEEPSSELEAVLAPRRPTAVLGSLGSLGSSSPFGGSPVLARPDAFGAARLPTPSPGFGFSLPSPNQAPAPSSSPFSARLAPAGSPYGARVTSSMPALQIPAPSGVAATTAGTSSGFFRSAQMPVAAVGAFVVAAFIFGMVTGAKFFGSHVSSTVASAQAVPPPAPVVIQPVAIPPAPVAAETPPAAAAVPTTPPPSPSAAAPTPPAPAAAVPVADDSAVAAPEPPKPAIKRARPAVRKPTTVAMDGAPAPKVAATPKSAAGPKPAAAPKTAKSGKTGKAKAWVDPFAE
jgi:hypothetical protein